MSPNPGAESGAVPLAPCRSHGGGRVAGPLLAELRRIATNTPGSKHPPSSGLRDTCDVGPRFALPMRPWWELPDDDAGKDDMEFLLAGSGRSSNTPWYDG
jgi:hypothetical protein